MSTDEQAPSTEEAEAEELAPAVDDAADEAAYWAHIEDVRACRKCAAVQPEPVVGPAFRARIMVVAQAPGAKEQESGRPFARTAGRTLFAWFARTGVSEEEFRASVHIASVVRCFPGKTKSGAERAPSTEEIRNCLPYLWTEIRLLRPGLIVPVGQLAVSKILPKVRLEQAVGERFEREIEGLTISVIPLPQPPGRSLWPSDAAERRRLERALNRIVGHPAWQQTFAPPTNRG
jgi:uracil-DNA glycosylase